MKFTHVLTFLTIAVSSLFADNAGSYASVTSKLTFTYSTNNAPVILANGNKLTTAVWNTYKLTVPAILAECQRQEIIPAGDVSGWKLLAIFDRFQLSGFAITNGTITLWIDSVIWVNRSNISGFASKGKWVRDSSGVVVSGATTYLDAYELKVSINGRVYVSTVAPQITDKVVSVGAQVDPVWRPSAFTISPVGIGEDSPDYFSILRGSLTISAAKPAADLTAALPGFAGFGQDVVD